MKGLCDGNNSILLLYLYVCSCFVAFPFNVLVMSLC